MHIGMPVVVALLLPMPLPVLVASVATSVAAVAVVSAAAVGDRSPVCLSACLLALVPLSVLSLVPGRLLPPPLQ